MLKTALIIPDCHIPYHDKRAYKLMLKVGRYLKPDEVTILGDYADFYCISGHKKSPAVKRRLLLEEVPEVNKHLDELDRLFPRAKKVFIEGNHEFRLERYLEEKCPELLGVTSTQHIFDFNRRRNWKFLPYKPSQKHKILGSYLYARHEPSGNSAKATSTKALCSLVYGHIHRIEESHTVGLLGTNHVCFSVGWIGDKTLDKVFDYVKGHHQWQLGFGVVYVDPKTGYFYHEKIHILDNYTCVVNGKLFRG